MSRDSIEEAAVHLVDALETLTGTRLSNQWNAAKKEGPPAPAASSKQQCQHEAVPELALDTWRHT